MTEVLQMRSIIACVVSHTMVGSSVRESPGHLAQRSWNTLNPDIPATLRKRLTVDVQNQESVFKSFIHLTEACFNEIILSEMGDGSPLDLCLPTGPVDILD